MKWLKSKIAKGENLGGFTDVLRDQPHQYYCIIENIQNENNLRLPDFLSEDGPMFVSNPIRIYSSEKGAKGACSRYEKHFHLICLSCFLNIVRSRIGITKMVLNGQFPCDVAAWRTPCQTTAILNLGTESYYIEGCQESGVFWRPAYEKPEQAPAFLTCGASDMDCIWDDCPNGWEFFDTVPITLCKITNNISQKDVSEDFIIRFDTPQGHFFYAGISPEGFDFAKKSEDAARLNGRDAFRLSRAIADVQINWSQGMMSEVPGCRVVAIDLQGKEVLSISQRQTP